MSNSHQMEQIGDKNDAEKQRESLIKQHLIEAEDFVESMVRAQEEETLSDVVRLNKCRFFAAFFLIGVFNNNGYVLVQAGASSLAESFKQQDFMGAFQFAMTGIGFCSRFLNGTVLVNIKHMIRFWMSTLLALTAFCLVALSAYKGTQSDDASIGWFYLAVFAAVLVGMSQAMGEACFLGFCSLYPSHVVGFVSSGTGCAGLTGSGSLLLFKSIGLQNYQIFMIAMPTLLIYIFCASWLA